MAKVDIAEPRATIFAGRWPVLPDSTARFITPHSHIRNWSHCPWSYSASMVRSKMLSRSAWWSESRCPDPGVFSISTSSPSSRKKPSSRATRSGRSWIAFIMETFTFFNALAMGCASSGGMAMVVRASFPGKAQGGHHFGDKQLHRAQGALGREVAEGEHQEQVVDPRLAHYPRELPRHRRWRAGDEARHRRGRGGAHVEQVRLAVLAREVRQVIAPDLVRGLPGPSRLGVAAGDEHVLGFPELGRAHMRVVTIRVVPVLRPDLAVLGVELPRFGRAGVQHGVIAMPCRELDRVPVAARKPEGRIGALLRLQVQVQVPVGEEFSLVIQGPVRAGGKEDVERLAVALARLVDAL